MLSEKQTGGITMYAPTFVNHVRRADFKSFWRVPLLALLVLQELWQKMRSISLAPCSAQI